MFPSLGKGIKHTDDLESRTVLGDGHVYTSVARETALVENSRLYIGYLLKLIETCGVMPG